MEQRIGSRKSPRKGSVKRRNPPLQAFQPNQIAIIAIARKRLVSTFPREKHLDMFPGQFGNVVHCDGGRLTDGLFHVPYVLGDEGREILRRDGHVVVLGAVPLGGQFCVWSLVGNFTTGEAYGESADLLICPVYGEAEDGSRIHSPTEKDTDGNIRDHVQLNRFGQQAL